MNSWNNQNQMMMGQAQFTPYNNNQIWSTQTRFPVYRADPIHGENAAWQFPIGGGEIYLPDADQDIIWWIKIDQNGNRSVTPFDVKLHKASEPVDINALVERINNLEEKVNAKFNKSNAKRAADAATATTD